ncbi:MAG: hypothetical protein K1X83_00355 [Oligoflexia bacterium]|nr:hypothetical protein [Oligoflexia bacterium]
MKSFLNVPSPSTASMELRHSTFPARSGIGALITLAALTPVVTGIAAIEAHADPGSQPESTSTEVLRSEQTAAHSASTITVRAQGREVKFNLPAVPPQKAETGASLPQPAKLSDWVFKGSGLALGAFGVISTLRGSGKVFKYLYECVKDREEFVGRECLKSPSCNLHSLTENQEHLDLEIHSIDKPELDDIIRNGYATRVFAKALALCTSEQPFPSLNLQRAASALIENRMAVAERKEAANLKLHLQELNKLFRDEYSSLYRDGLEAHAVGLKTTQDTHILIPICEVVPNNGRDLVFVAIAERDFLRFGKPEDLARIRPTLGRAPLRIAQLEQAYTAEQEFRQQHGCDLFPRIAVHVRS